MHNGILKIQVILMGDQGAGNLPAQPLFFNS